MYRFVVGIVSLLTVLNAQSVLADVTAEASKTISAHDGTPIVFEVHGSGETALVFVHGWGCNRGQWHNQIDAFEDDYTLVMIDLPGHGESGDGRKDWAHSNFARDVKAVADELHLERMVLIGHSMGGPVILMAAALMPERVVGVVPVDTIHDVEFQWPEGIFEALELQMKTNFAGFMNQFVSSSLNPDVDAAVKQGIIDDAQDNDPNVAWAIFQEFETLDVAKIVSACPVPMHSINSAVLETKVETNRQYNADFDAEIIEGSGHWVMLEKPEAFNAALRTVLDGWMGDSE